MKEIIMLPIGFEPMISTLLVWRLTNLAIEAIDVAQFNKYLLYMDQKLPILGAEEWGI